MKIAIIGTGISGLTTAYLLNKKHDVTVFEKNEYIGGHTHTHDIILNDKNYAVDSGFICYNENTYPNFIKLLKILGVESQKTTMGFSVKSEKKNLEYAGNSLSSLFSQKKNIFSISFLLMIRDILSFNKNAKNHFPSHGTATISGLIVKADPSSGQAVGVKPLVMGGVLREI